MGNSKSIGFLVLLIVLAIGGIWYIAITHRSEPEISKGAIANAMSTVVDCYMARLSSRLLLPTESPGQCPPAVFVDSRGEALYSWRLPMITATLTDWDGVVGCSPDYYLRWDSEENRCFRSYPMNFYCYSSQSRIDCTTNCMAVVGPGTCFDKFVTRKPEALPSETIMFLEVKGLGVNWMEPGDVSPSWIETQLNSSPSGPNLGVNEEGFHVAFVDEEVWFLRRDIPFKTLEPFLFVKESDERSRDESLGGYRIIE